MVYFIYLLAGSLEGVRILNDILFFISVILMFYLAEELLGGLWEGFVGSALYVFFMNVPALEGMYALPASMAIPFIVAGSYSGLVYWRRGKKYILVLAGVLVSVAGLLYAREFSFMLILVFIIRQRMLPERSWIEIMRNAGFLLTGTLVPFLPFVFYYAGYGRICTLVPNILRPLYYFFQIGINPPLWVLLTILEILPLAILSVIGAIITITRELRYRGLLMLMLILACIINIFTLKFFGHYWLNTVVPSALLATVAISALVRANHRTAKSNALHLAPKTRTLAISLLVLSSSISFYIQIQQLPIGSIQWGPAQMVYSPFGSYQNQTLLATFLRDNTNNNDQILVHGWMPEVYYLSGIEAPTPNLNTVLVGVTIPKAEYQGLLNMIVQQKFKYIVLANWANWDIDSIATITRAYYNRIDRIGYCELYEPQRLCPLLQNPSFEDTSNWVITNPTYATYTSTCAHTGNRSIAVIQSSNVQFCAVYQDIPVKGNTEYILSAWSINSLRNDFWFSIREVNSDGELLQLTNVGTSFFSPSEWSPTAYKFTTLDATTKVLICINTPSLGFNYTTYFDDVELLTAQY
jgi:hypothetical protein